MMKGSINPATGDELPAHPKLARLKSKRFWNVPTKFFENGDERQGQYEVSGSKKRAQF